ncbi:MAG: hypothetical protein P1U67_08225 [Alcanivoracaceae bacterium]|nr:hypothetical protein [Alcanivoracaceae bacterium]
MHVSKEMYSAYMEKDDPKLDQMFSFLSIKGQGIHDYSLEKSECPAMFF